MCKSIFLSCNEKQFRSIFFFIFLFFIFRQPIIAQKYEFTHDDTLRGSITAERAWWDLQFYHLRVAVSPQDSSLTGSTEIRYKVLLPRQTIQIDLQRPLNAVKILQDNQELAFVRDGNAFLVKLQKPQKVGSVETITFFYTGRPRVARRPPWDGGLTWKKDSQNNWFVATSCQGLGASAWWPCKDHMADEPDSMAISVTVPAPLTGVSNGRLRHVTDNQNGTRTFDWYVQNPINNYGVNLNVANYVHWNDSYAGEKGPLDLSFYALPANEAKARQQFMQSKTMLQAFEHWFGPYPFYEDSYKLVETPYLGMEHQSSVTYGNGYQNGYLGTDLSGTGWGLKWDFIIIHESGHEWFANNITHKDAADMWVHEGFTNYSECLYTEFFYGKEAGAAYVIGTRKNIRNDKPIIGIYNVNRSGSSDMYYKGGNMLHTIRQIVNDDQRWRRILRGLNQTFYHQTVTTAQIEDYMSQQAGIDLTKVFDQYLRDVRVPVFEYKIADKKLTYRWANCVDGFAMPFKISTQDGRKFRFINPTTNWQTLKIGLADEVVMDNNFYVNFLRVP